MYKKIVDIIPIGKLRPGIKLNWDTITIHSTGNEKSTALNERGWLTNSNNNRIASWHYVIDENNIVQAIPENEVAYHAGSKKGNLSSLGVEICESGDRIKTLDNATTFIAEKLKEKHFYISNLRQHFDWTEKNCPRILRDKKYILVKDGIKYDWKWFLEEVARKMRETEKPEIKEEKDMWKKEIIQKALDLGIISNDEWLEKYDEKASVWFVLSVALNVIKVLKGGK